MGIDFSTINSPALYTDGVNVNDHLPVITFDDGSEVDNDKTYDSFGFAVLSNNGTMVNGQALKDKVSQSRADKATKLGLRGSAFSDYVELGIASVKANRDNAITSLPQVPSDITFQKEPLPTTGTSLVEVLKNAQDNQNDILSVMLNAFNEMTTLLKNQNDLLLEKNKIDLERNRIMDVMQLSQNAKDTVMVESLTSLAQSLEYIPTLIETIAIGNDKQSELLNTQNSHLFQKNVNDAYAFNYNKDDEKSPQKSLDAVAGNLASIAQAHAKIQEHQEKQAKDAENNIKDFEDENSLQAKSVFDGFIDFMSGVVDEAEEVVLGDNPDIFTHFIKETSIKEKDLNNE